MPPTTAETNVVVVEGNNGAGKTSLLEAIMFCLYGRSALGLVARASGLAKPDQSYDGFLERALSVNARGEIARMSVALEFVDGADQVAVERAWYFGPSGRHRRDEEEVRLMEGPDLDVVTMPDELDTVDYVREFVARRLLPENLAGFFLLDGEHLERMAGYSIDDQVRGAVEVVFGAPALRSLANDLRAYARERRRHLPHSANRFAGVASEELAEFEAEERVAVGRIDVLIASLAPLRKSREEIVRRIGSLHGDSYRSFKALFEERESAVRTRDEQRDELRRLLSGDLAFSLAGPTLRRRAIERIGAEEQAERWQSGSASSRNRFSDFIAAVHRRTGTNTDLDAALWLAWDEVWSVRPDDCAEDIRHKHLSETDRRAVSEQLERLSSVRSDTFTDLSRRVSDLDRRIEEIEREIGRQRGLEGESLDLANELTKIQEQIASIEAEHRSRVEELNALRAKVTVKREEVDNLLADSASAAPLIARAGRAERFADLADRLVEALLPESLGSLSERITRAYRSMAHKTVVQSIRIQSAGAVQLLDDLGEDLRRVDASAGESQIFALAVMSALASLAGDFPIIMDTPLARLDPLHRRNVLNHFANCHRQLILLTHPAELGPEERTIIATRIAGFVQIGEQSMRATTTAGLG